MAVRRSLGPVSLPEPIADVVAEVRRAFETETVTARVLARVEAAVRRALASGDPEHTPGWDAGELRSCKLHLDPDHLFSVHVSHLHAGKTRPVHDHGTLGWAVYGVWRGEVVQRLYERLDDGSKPGRATLRALPPLVQRAGDALLVGIDAIHTPENAEEAWTLVVRSRDIPTVWRNRFDVERGTVERFRGGTG